MFAVEFVVLEAPAIKRCEELLKKAVHFGIRGIESGCLVVEDYLSLFVPHVPIGMLLDGAGVRIGNEPYACFQPLRLDVLR